MTDLNGRRIELSKNRRRIVNIFDVELQDNPLVGFLSDDYIVFRLNGNAYLALLGIEPYLKGHTKGPYFIKWVLTKKELTNDLKWSDAKKTLTAEARLLQNP